MIRGIGGVFIYARDAESLVRWYTQHLGIEFQYEASEGSHYHDFVLPVDPHYGRTEREVLAIRQADPATAIPQRRLVINLRTQDLPQLIEQLRTQGITIQRTEHHDYGTFAWLQDPEGHELELFEPSQSNYE